MKIVGDDAGVFALADDWAALWMRCPAATPFQSPAWLLPWWRSFGNGTPRVAYLRDPAGALAGVLPLFRMNGALLPFGAGITDYQDCLRAPDAPDNAASWLLESAFGAGLGQGDLIDVPPDAVLRRVDPPPGWCLSWHDSDPCPVLDLRHGWDAAVPSRMRRKLRMNANRGDAAGGVTAEIATDSTAIEHVIRLHTQRWAAGGEPGVLADPAVLAFHRHAAPGLHAAGLLRIGLLRAAVGEVVAAILAYLDRRDRVFFYLSGYAAHASAYSPTSLLLAHMLQVAAGEGRSEAHFLRGGEAYKYAWGAVDRWNATGRLIRA